MLPQNLNILINNKQSSNQSKIKKGGNSTIDIIRKLSFQNVSTFGNHNFYSNILKSGTEFRNDSSRDSFGSQDISFSEEKEKNEKKISQNIKTNTKKLETIKYKQNQLKKVTDEIDECSRREIKQCNWLSVYKAIFQERPNQDLEEINIYLPKIAFMPDENPPETLQRICFLGCDLQQVNILRFFI